jgi:acetyltransferase-like isoleucine patch superfamily enzyme
MESLPYIVGSGRIYIGCNVRLSGKPFITFGHVSGVSRPELLIGDDTFIGHGCTFGIAGSVTIGRHCLLAGGVRIQDYDGHPLDAALRRVGQPVGLEDVKPVEIADDVWVGTGALILKGVKIGQGAIIGARAVVTNDVLPNTVVAGNPAKLIKELITDLPGPAVSRSR